MYHSLYHITLNALYKSQNKREDANKEYRLNGVFKFKS